MLRRALFVSRNLIGDALYISPALHVWHSMNPDFEIGILTHKNHITPLYSVMGVPVNIFTKDEDAQQWFEEANAATMYHFNVNAAFDICQQKKCHIAEAYAELIGVNINEAFAAHVDRGAHRNIHLKPIVQLDDEPLEDELKGLFLVSMFSNSCSSRQGGLPNKMLDFERHWPHILRYLRSFDVPIRFLGAPEDRISGLDISDDEYLLGIPLRKLVKVMRHASLLVTIDNGMGHLAASQSTPTFLFYPQCLATHFILPLGNPNLVYLHVNPATLDIVPVLSAMRHTVPNLLNRGEPPRLASKGRLQRDYELVVLDNKDGAID